MTEERLGAATREEFEALKRRIAWLAQNSDKSKNGRSPAERVLDDLTRVAIGVVVCVFGVMMLLLSLQAYGEGITPWPGVILGIPSLVCGVCFVLAGVLPEE